MVEHDIVLGILCVVFFFGYCSFDSFAIVNKCFSFSGCALACGCAVFLFSFCVRVFCLCVRYMTIFITVDCLFLYSLYIYTNTVCSELNGMHTAELG